MNENKKLMVYLADLDHFFPGNRVSIPLGIGSIKGYCMSRFSEEIKIKLFKNPEKLMKEIKQTPPDVLGCSFYMWNTNLTLKVLECCKKINPSTITVIGGPNVARITDRYMTLLKQNSSLDVVVLDQGEKSFANILQRILSYGIDKRVIFSRSIPGCAIKLDGSDSIERGEIVNDISDLNRMPSPYLMGYFDSFLEDGFLPSFETVRGCPHSCSYCGGGDRFVNKLIIKDEEIVYEELRYLLKHSKLREIDLIDTNFGILGERDLRIISFIRDLYKKHNFPFIVAFATTKDQRKTTIEIMKKLAEITGMLYFGVQTLTGEVLQNCKRKNVPINTMEKLIRISKKTNMPVHVDLIFGLPGETKSSFIKTMSKLRSMGVESLVVYQLRLLPGTVIAEFEREKYQYKTKFRPINNRFGEYELIPGEKPIRIVEAEEIACESSTFNFNDYLTIREFGFMTALLTGYGTFSDTIAYLLSKNIDVIDVLQFIQQNQNQYPMLHTLFREYRECSEKELSPTENDLIENLTENDAKWNDLMSGGGSYFKINIGFVGYCLLDNITLLNDIADIMKQYAKHRLSSEEMNNLEEILRRDRQHWLVHEKDEGRLKPSDIKEEISFTEHFDYEKWKLDGFKGNLSDYELSTPVQQTYYIKRYKDILKTIEGLSDLSGYNFYERIISQAPSVSLKRFQKKHCPEQQKEIVL